MASRRVAFLRGINNIGKGPRVSMADLRALFEDLGFRNVTTVLNSGNVAFSGGRGDARTRIEKALVAKLGVRAEVTVLTGSEVVSVVRGNPFASVESDPSRVLVVVLRDPANRMLLQPLLDHAWKPEALALGKRVAYLWCARTVAESVLWPKVDRALGRSGSARNIGTMTKLMNLVSA